MASSLNELAKEVRGSRLATERVADNFDKWFKAQERSRLDQLERDREARKTAPQGKSDTKPAAIPQEKKKGGFLDGLQSPLAGFGLGALAKGLGVMGAGIGAFFLGMAGAEAIMGKFAADSGGKNIRDLMVNTAEGLKAFAAPEMLKFGALLAGGALFGAIAGPRRSAYAAVGMGAVGFGIGAFLTGFSVADFAIEKTGANGANLPIIAQNVYDTISIFTKDNTGLAIAGLVGAGGLLGAAAGGGRRGGMGLVRGTMGMIGSNMVTFGIGAAIGSFFAGFAAVDSGAEKIGDGSTIKKVAKNLKATLEVFKDMEWVNGLIAGGAILGAVAGATGGAGLMVAGGAAIGANMVTFGIGAAIGAFFAGFAAVDGVTSYLTKDDSGSKLKEIATNMADALKKLADLDSVKITASAGAIGTMGGAMFKFFGAQGLGTITGAVDGGIETVKGIFRWLTGAEEDNDDLGKGPIADIIRAMEPLNDLDDDIIKSADRMGEALDRLFVSFNSIAQVGNITSFGKNIASMVNDLGFVLNVLPALINGGKVMDGTQNWLSSILGTGRGVIADFGGGLKNLKAEDLQILKTGVEGLYGALGVDIPTATPAEPIVDTDKQLEPAIRTLDSVVNEIRDRVNGPAGGAGLAVQNNNNISDNSSKQIIVMGDKDTEMKTQDWLAESQRIGG